MYKSEPLTSIKEFKTKFHLDEIQIIDSYPLMIFKTSEFETNSSRMKIVTDFLFSSSILDIQFSEL